MTTQSKYVFPVFPDMQSVWSMNQQSLGDAGTAVRAWFEFSSRAQEHATKFISGRWAKDAAALAQFGQCKTPVEALNCQMTYLTGACADYMNEGQKIVGFFGEVARESLPGLVDRESATGGRAKHSPHRVAAH